MEDMAHQGHVRRLHTLIRDRQAGDEVRRCRAVPLGGDLRFRVPGDGRARDRSTLRPRVKDRLRLGSNICPREGGCHSRGGRSSRVSSSRVSSSRVSSSREGGRHSRGARNSRGSRGQILQIIQVGQRVTEMNE